MPKLCLNRLIFRVLFSEKTSRCWVVSQVCSYNFPKPKNSSKVLFRFLFIHHDQTSKKIRSNTRKVAREKTYIKWFVTSTLCIKWPGLLFVRGCYMTRSYFFSWLFLLGKMADQSEKGMSSGTRCIHSFVIAIVHTAYLCIVIVIRTLFSYFFPSWLRMLCLSNCIWNLCIW